MRTKRGTRSWSDGAIRKTHHQRRPVLLQRQGRIALGRSGACDVALAV